MNLIKTPKKETDVFKENAKLRGALIEMLTVHGKKTMFYLTYFEQDCDCHACTNARKLLAGE